MTVLFGCGISSAAAVGMLGWAGVAAAGVAAGAAALWAGISVAGGVMPREQVVARRVRLRAGRGAVWEALADMGAEPEWFGGLVVQRLPDRGGRPVWVLKFNRDELEVELVEVEHPRRLHWQVRDGRRHFAAVWTFVLAEAAGGGTELKTVEQTEIHRPAARFITRWVLGEADYLDRFLKALMAKVNGTEGGPSRSQSGS